MDKLVQEYVMTVSYSVIMEAQTLAFFKPNRGLHQGGPLSPYLFLLCTEGPSFLLHKVEQNSI